MRYNLFIRFFLSRGTDDLMIVDYVLNKALFLVMPNVYYSGLKYWSQLKYFHQYRNFAIQDGIQKQKTHIIFINVRPFKTTQTIKIAKST